MGSLFGGGYRGGVGRTISEVGVEYTELGDGENCSGHSTQLFSFAIQNDGSLRLYMLRRRVGELL